MKEGYKEPRFANLGDAIAIDKLFENYYKIWVGFFNAKEWISSNKIVSFVIEKENTNEIVAHAGVKPFWFASDPQIVEIGNLVVSKEHRKNGIGTKLVENITEYIHSRDDINLLTVCNAIDESCTEKITNDFFNFIPWGLFLELNASADDITKKTSALYQICNAPNKNTLESFKERKIYVSKKNTNFAKMVYQNMGLEGKVDVVNEDSKCFLNSLLNEYYGYDVSISEKDSGFLNHIKNIYRFNLNQKIISSKNKPLSLEWIDISKPSGLIQTQIFEEEGYFVGGFLPKINNYINDTVGLEYLSSEQEVNFDNIRVYSSFSDRIKQEVQKNYFKSKC